MPQIQSQKIMQLVKNHVWQKLLTVFNNERFLMNLFFCN